MQQKALYYKQNGGQADGYNNSLEDYGCDYPYNGKPYTGCVATAIAQVMRYHQYPPVLNYNWNAMPDDGQNLSPNAPNELSDLMKDIGDEVDMDWGCDASGADDDDIDDALQNFGYNSAHQIGYDGTAHYEDVIDEIDNDRPVIFSGCSKDHVIGIFPVARDCHAWVADGYRDSIVCPSGNGYLYFSMNWGWDGSYNGFYGYNDFDPDGQSFDYKSEVVVDIEPPQL